MVSIMMALMAMAIVMAMANAMALMIAMMLLMLLSMTIVLMAICDVDGKSVGRDDCDSCDSGVNDDGADGDCIGDLRWCM